MPSKKRKYNARFPAGRIKKIMQTDEEVGKVAQAVPIIISRTLELFVQSLLGKALQVTTARNAKTLSPSHVKHCILGEARFDFLKDLVKNIPDVSAAEEKEMMSAENSPNSSRFSDMSVQPRRTLDDSNSSSGSDVRTQPIQHHTRSRSTDADPPKHRDNDRPDLLRSKSDLHKTIPPMTSNVIDLSLKESPVRTTAANFYQETLVDHSSVIKLNPTYSPQPSTSYNDFTYANLNDIKHIPKPEPKFSVQLRQELLSTVEVLPMPSTPVLNIDFTKGLAKPEIKVLDANVASVVPKDLKRQNSKKEKKLSVNLVQPAEIDLDHFNSGNLQIDEDYDT